MARLHSRKKGKSGRKRPKSNDVPEWSNVDKAKVEETIIKLAKEGVPPSKIGIIMRDQYCVPNIRGLLGMSLLKFLKKEGVAPEYPEDLIQLITKAVRMQRHLKTNKKDVHNRVKLSHVESKIHRLVKYYKKQGVLPKDWKYSAETAALLVK